MQVVVIDELLACGSIGGFWTGRRAPLLAMISRRLFALLSRHPGFIVQIASDPALIAPRRLRAGSGKCLGHGRLHIVIAASRVGARHAGGVELPGCDNVIASTTVVKGKF